MHFPAPVRRRDDRHGSARVGIPVLKPEREDAPGADIALHNRALAALNIRPKRLAAVERDCGPAMRDQRFTPLNAVEFNHLFVDAECAARERAMRSVEQRAARDDELTDRPFERDVVAKLIK